MQQDPNDDKKVKWKVDFSMNKIDLKKVASSSSIKTEKQNSGFSDLKIVVNSADNKRSITGDPLIMLQSKNNDLFCNFCQKEDGDDFIKCSNPKCTTAFCKNCLLKKIKNTKSSKCPNCPNNFEIPEISTIKGQSQCFALGRLEHSILNDPLPGYERYKTIEFYYICENGIQNVR